MTSQELKELLETIAKSLESVKDVCEPDLMDKIIAFLNNLDRTTMDLIITFLKGNHPDINQEIVVKNVQKITEVLVAIHKMIVSGQIDELISKCRSLENKSMLLTIISRFF